MKVLGLSSLVGLASAMGVLEVDYFYRQCNALTIANKAIVAACSSGSSSNSTKSKRAPSSKIKATCYCALDEFQLSFYECIAYAKEVADAPEASIKDSWDYMRYACGNQGYDNVRKWDDILTLVEENPVNQSFAAAAKSLKGAFLPNTTAMTTSLGAIYVERHWQSYHQELFGMITVWYVAGILLAQSILHWSAYLVPGFIRVLFNNPLGRQVRRHVALPALFNKHRSTPVRIARYFMLCFPPRLQSIFLTGYVFLCIFFLAFHYPHVMDKSYWSSYKQLVSAYLAARAGSLAMYKMPFVYLFAGRNNILIWLTGWQFEVFNHWHRWISRLFTVDIIIHAIAYSVDLNTTHYYKKEWADDFMRWGAVALVCMSLMCLNGTKTMRQLAYETFLYVHIIFAVFTCVGTYYHVSNRLGYLNQYAAWAFWAFDRAVRLFRISFSNPFAKCHIRARPGDCLEIHIKYSGWWKPTAGTYIFVHFMHPLYFIQSHPFTVVPVDEKGEMKLYAKALNGITRTLLKKAQANGGECDYRVLVEGPYGVSFATKQYKEMVLLAGGIGITAVYSHLQHIVKTAQDQIIHVHWAMSTPEALGWFEEELGKMIAHKNVHVVIHGQFDYDKDEKEKKRVSGEEDDKQVSVSANSVDNLSYRNVSFRPSYNQIISDHIEHSQGDICFFVCGPATMTDAVRASVASNMFRSKNLVQYYEESFSM